MAIGTAIITRAGPPSYVKSIKANDNEDGATVYNFEIEDSHTYFVGCENGGIWVHNGGQVCALGRARSAGKRYGGTDLGDNHWKFPNKRAAKKAASDIAGNLGSKPTTLRMKDYRGGPAKFKDSKQVYGKTTTDKSAGWRDDFPGHEFVDKNTKPYSIIETGPHVNAWADGVEFHLFY